MPTLADLLTAADRKFNAPQGYGTLADMTRGAAAATVPSYLGAPVDLATMLLNVPLSAMGRKIENPVGGSQQIARMMGLAGPQKAEGAPMNSYDKGYLLSSLLQMAAPMVAPAVASRGRVAPTNQDGAIRVFHGSPHKFNKASSEHIGRGEGAQAYGHGLYWAESPDVAMNYQPRDMKLEDALMRRYKAAENAQDYAAASVYEDFLLHKTPAEVQKSIAGAGYDKADLAKAERALKAATAEWQKQKSGYLYEADLRWPDAAREAADPMGPQHFLNYDKGLDAQPKAVKEALKARLKELGYSPTSKGLKAYQIEHGGFAANFGDSYLSVFGKTPEDAAKYLSDRGVPGIAYLDQASRDSGKGTRNFVTFSDDLIELLKRNGEPLR